MAPENKAKKANRCDGVDHRTNVLPTNRPTNGHSQF